MRDLTNHKLFDLAKQQFQEADEALRVRLPRWKYALDCWRGVFRESGYYESIGYDSFYRDTGLQPDDEILDSQDFRVYVREVFRHCETFLSRLDKAYLTNPKPFTLRPPKVVIGTPPPAEVVARKAEVLDGVAQWLAYDYHAHAVSSEQLMALRDLTLCDVGYTVHRRCDTDDPYPRPMLERIAPWETRPDPLSQRLQTARYCILGYWFSLGEALTRWPDAKDTLKRYIQQERTSEGRRDVRVYRYLGWYDPSALEGALPDDELQDFGNPGLGELWFLGTFTEPTQYLLDGYPMPFGMKEIPVQEYTVLYDPEERGPYGVSVASLVFDDEEAANILFNRMLQQFEYATLQGGFYDTAFAGQLETPLQTTPRPGEWKALAIGKDDFSKALMPLQYPNFTKDHMALLQFTRQEPTRKTGVSDQQQGMSVPTNTDTLGEVTLLQNETNEIFRFRARALDVSFKRSYRLHVQVAADALRSWLTEHPGQALYFQNPETDEYVPLDPSVFDEEWEVELLSGSSYVDGNRRAQKLLQYAMIARQAGLPGMMEKVLRKAMTLDQEDPDIVLGKPQEVQAMQAQAALMAMAQAAGGGGGAVPGGPGVPGIAPPGAGIAPQDPGLATRAAMAGQRGPGV